MELIDRFRDVVRLLKAIRREEEEGFGAALAGLTDGPRSRRYRSLWQTFVARLRVLSREGKWEAELPPLHDRPWFIAPSDPLDTYCKTYVLYMQAYLRCDESSADQHRSTLRQLSVARFVRSALLVT